MIAFRLDNMLHMQYDQMIQALLDGWEMGSVYAIDENEIIFQLKNGQIRAYSFMENSFTKAVESNVVQAMADAFSKVSEDDPDYLFKTNSDGAEICKFLLLLIRRVYELKPHADKHMTQVLLAKLNKRLESCKLQIGLDREEYIMPTFILEGQIVSLEKAIEAVRAPKMVQVQNQTTEVVTKSIVQYIEVPTLVEVPKAVVESAESLKDVDEAALEETASDTEAGKEDTMIETAKISTEVAEEEAPKEDVQEEIAEETNAAVEKPEGKTEPSPISDSVKALFESALNGAKPGSEVYHSICFAMGEIMYYRDELESAIYFYQKCEIDRIEDKEDFYERLGHCYLDDKMDAFSSVLKLIYRAEHNEAFKESHKEELEKCPHFSRTEISAYREKCISLGAEMYDKKANS